MPVTLGTAGGSPSMPTTTRMRAGVPRSVSVQTTSKRGRRCGQSTPQRSDRNSNPASSWSHRATSAQWAASTDTTASSRGDGRCVTTPGKRATTAATLEAVSLAGSAPSGGWLVVSSITLSNSQSRFKQISVVSHTTSTLTAVRPVKPDRLAGPVRARRACDRLGPRESLPILPRKDLVVQPEDAVDQHLRSRGTPRNVHIHRDDLVHPLDQRVVVEDAPAGGAGPHRDDPFR